MHNDNTTDNTSDISIESSQLPLKPLVMDQLPSERECGSYLEVDEYFDFSMSWIIYMH